MVKVPRILRILFFAGLFLVTFLFFLYWMFPMHAVKNRIVHTVEGALGGAYQLKVEEVDTYWITGVELEEVVLSQVVEGKEEVVLRLDRVHGKVGLLSYLFGSPKVRFEARKGDSRFRGTLKKMEEGWEVRVDFKRIDLSQFPFLQRQSGLNLSSSIDGEIQVTVNPTQPLRTEGEISLEFDKLVLKKGEISLGEMGTLPLPTLPLATSNSTLSAKIAQGSIQVNTLRLQGKDSLFDLKGRIFLAREVSKYRMNLKGKVKFPPMLWSLLEKNAPDKFLNNLKKQQEEDESYPLSVAGQLSFPQIYSGSLKIYPLKLSDLF